ncbi:hypothetical protein BVRB_1g012660 [Beta vulgaris subsp. vulgaris]|uniref:regulator of nonsense transcripts UPF3 isoform X1 n=1 Tax=Beta vulgaris subsp. vulgaris TaxID=3555 RepID=UPI00053FDCFA|nr:regulator of nonsense transcripts UPF3 isoform X1 [Beta vulgaris subsp. vulgaris]XP_048500500.1 regulator of nonsense transcripts UPF3 isoform X1 [Beta vulgaris subsp. vulgaris]KMT19420.1 hypothetical protein BVRB_1g012660 [Beta vulgaris subsp. vulgaris]
MKEPLNRTKVVVRHLPPSLSHSSFFEQIDGRFSSRYNWSSFRPGNSSHTNQRYGRAYVNFNSPDDVFEFAEFFNGHVFVNEKGTQYKAIVEYAPSQRVPKSNAKKDGREGTIYKDPEYLEFLERISKPVENLPSADIQLERKEAERAGVQEAPIVTPLMEYVRRRRAARSSSQHLGSDGKSGGRSLLASSGKSRSSKQNSEKKKYILKNNGKSTNGKEKSTYILVSQRENELDASIKKEVSENETGSGLHDTTKKRILLLKGKEQELSQASEGSILPKIVTSPAEVSSSPSVGLKLNQRPDASGRIIRSILLNKEPRLSQSSSQAEQKLQGSTAERSKRPPRPSNIKAGVPASVGEQSPSGSDYVGKRAGEDKSSGREPHGFGSAREKQDRRTRSRERLDRGVWTPRRSDSSHTGDENQSNISDSYEGKRGESKYDTSGRSTDAATLPGGRNSSFAENGSHRNFGRRGPAHSAKDDVPSKRGGAVGHGLHEKQVWVQKSASGS